MVNGKKLTLNKYKTKCMVVGSRQKLTNIERAPEIKLGGSSIKCETQWRSVGCAEFADRTGWPIWGRPIWGTANLGDGQFGGRPIL